MNLNLFWCIIGIIGGAITSLSISAFFYLIEKRQKKLSYKIETECIISNKIIAIDNLEINYKSSKITNLYSTTITLINMNKLVIEESDFSKYEPISVSTNGQFILQENNTQLTPIYLDNEGKKTCNKIHINFDFIPKKSTSVYNFIHTGNINFNYCPKKINVIDYNTLQKKKNTKHFTSICIFFFLLVVIISVYICNYFYTAGQNDVDKIISYTIERTYKEIKENYTLVPKK